MAHIVMLGLVLTLVAGLARWRCSFARFTRAASSWTRTRRRDHHAVEIGERGTQRVEVLWPHLSGIPELLGCYGRLTGHDAVAAGGEAKQEECDRSVNDATTASLAVEDLGEAKSGGVALWAGNGSDGAYANLSITPAASGGKR